MSSFEKFVTSPEPTPAVSDDTFAAALHAAAASLDSPIVIPEVESFEVLRVPFGRFNEGGTLAADAAWNGNLSGRIIFTPEKSDSRARLHVSREIVDTDWGWRNYSGRLSNEALVERLRADWPLDQAVPVETDTNDDWVMYEWLNKSLLSLAPYWRTERSYRHDHIIIEPDGSLHHDSTSVLAARTYQDLLQRLRFTTAIQTDKDAEATLSHATVNEFDAVELHAYRRDSDTNRVTEIAIANRAIALGSMLILLERLMKERSL